MTDIKEFPVDSRVFFTKQMYQFKEHLQENKKIKIVATTINGSQWITRMPADGDDATTLMMLDNLLSHLGERHAVEVLCVAHLDAAELEAHHGGPVATDILHIAGIGLIVPGQTVERIVLMTEPLAFTAECVEALHQLLCHRLLRLCLFLCRASGYCYCRDCHHYQFLHFIYFYFYLRILRILRIIIFFFLACG